MEKQSENQRLCIWDDKIVLGRPDKKFCNNKCKNAFNNLKNRKLEKIIKPDKRKLLINYKALEMYYESSLGVDFIAMRPLLQKGFNPRFYIGTMVFKNTGETAYLVYTYAFIYDPKAGIKIFYQDGGFHNS